MHPLLRSVLFCLLAAAPVEAAAAQHIIPSPQAIAYEEGALRLDSIRSIVLGRSTSTRDFTTAEKLRDELKRAGLDVSVDYEGPETTAKGSIWVADGGERADGYRLIVRPDGVRIEGATPRGRFYGAVSILQLMRGAADEIPALWVEDYPELELRGVVHALPGRIPTPPTFAEIVRFLGEHKMNAYVLPVGGLFPFSAYDTLEAPTGLVRLDELAALRDTAEAYHVDLIPAFRWRDLPDSLRRAIDPQSDDALRLLGEILEAFPSDYAYLEVGGGTGFGPEGERRLYGLVRRHARVLLVDRAGSGPGRELEWISDGAPAWSSDSVIVVDNQYAAGERAQGGRAPAESFPSDRLYGPEGPRAVVGPALSRWGRLFPDPGSSWRNLSRHVLQSYRSGVSGVLGFQWEADEEGAPASPDARAAPFRLFAYVAEFAWNPDGGGGSSIDRRFDRLFYGLDDPPVRDLAAEMGRVTAGRFHPQVWDHPLHRAAYPAAERVLATPGWPDPPSARLPAAAQDAAVALRTIESLQAIVPRNADRLDYDAFAARFAGWLAETEDLAGWIRHMRREGSPDELEEQSGYGAAWASALAGEGRVLTQAFRSLWLREHREEGLDRGVRPIQRQRAYLEEMARWLDSGRWDVPTIAPSRFISARDAATPRGTAPPGAGSSSGDAFLRTTFYLERGQIADAYLQTVARDEVDAWINGRRAGGPPDVAIDAVGARLVVRNVASRLRSGRNVLALHVEDLRENTAAEHAPSMSRELPAGSVNAYLEIHYVDGRIRHVASTADWKARPVPEPRWYEDSFSDDGWPRAVVAESAPVLTMPMFDRGFPSRIEAGRPREAP